MATLSGNKIKDTYQSLVKFSDNGNITTSAKQLTDGFGNNSPMYVSTTQVGIGVTPESGLNLHVYGDAKIGSNLTIIGNLVVEGSTTTVGTDTLTVKDPLIVLANNNTSTDAVDIGFYGKYTPSGTTLYSGLFREALTGKYRLFKDLQVEPTTTVNTGGTGYAQATLIAALEGDVTGNITGNVTGNLTGNLTGNVTGNVTGDLTGDVTGDVTGDLTGNVTGGSITATTGLFTDNVNIAGTLVIDDELTVEGSAFGRIEIGGPSGGYIDLKAPNSDDYDLRLITSTGGGELLSIDTLKFYTGATTDLAFTIDASQNATFENNVTIPETPTADTHAASKGYVDAAVEGQDTLAEILANGNTSGANDIIMADNQKIYYGTGSDVEMYFDGATQFGIINDTAGGSIFLRSGSFAFTNGTNQFYSMSSTTHTLKSSGTARLTVNASGADVNGVMSSVSASILTDLAVDTDTLFVDASEDSVGIGLTNPADYTADELVISVPDGSGMTLVSGTTDAAYITFMSSTGAIATNGGYIGYDHNADTLTNFAQSKVSVAILEAEVAYFTDTAFFVDKSTTIDDNLSVSDDLGVGISVPLYKLDVVSSAADTARFTSTSSTTTNVYIGNSNATANNTANLYFMPANNIAGSYIKSTAIEDFSTAANRTSDLRFGVRKDGTFNEAVIIDSSGNVGIGTTSPASKLVVRTSTDHNFEVEETGGELRLSALNDARSANIGLQFAASEFNFITGNVGIGTDSPAEKLHVENGNIRLKSNSDGNNGILRLYDAAGTESGQIYPAAGDLRLYTPNDIIMSPTGNVGIGTTTPAAALDIKHASALLATRSTNNDAIAMFNEIDNGYSHLYLYQIGGSAKVVLRSNGNSYFNGGNVGIGTTSPDITGFGWNALTVVGGTTAGSAGVLELGAPSTDANDQNYGIIAFMGGTGRNAQIAANRDSATNDGRLSFWTSPGAGGIVERMRIASTGNVGIGSQSNGTLNNKLQVSTGVDGDGIILTGIGDNTGIGNGSYRKIGFRYDDTDESFESEIRFVVTNSGAHGGQMEFFTDNTSGTKTRAVTIDNAQRVGIGTSSPSYKLDVQVSGNVARFGDGTRFFRVYTDADEVSLLADGSVPMKFYTSGTERMRITSTGNILVGTTGTPNGTSVYGSAFIDGGSGLRQLFQASSTTTSVSIQRFYNPNGNVGSIQTNGSSTSYSTSSDYRLKENVVEMTGALDRVSQLKPSRFNFIADADKTVDGFLAHEVQDIVPEAITGEKDAVDEEGNPEYQGIDQSKLVPLLVGAIQELKAEIELLKTQINN